MFRVRYVEGIVGKRNALKGVETYVECFGNPDVPETTPAMEQFQMFYKNQMRRENVDALTARRAL